MALLDSTTAVLWTGASAAILLISVYLLGHRRQSGEPPEAQSAFPVPYIGHAIGLFKHHIGYYPLLR